MRRGIAAVPVLALMLLAPLAVAAANTGASIVSCPTATACYSPNPIRITVGSTVTWTNNHGATHTATADSLAWDTGPLTTGATSGAITFNTPGTFAYHCRFHADMHGSIIVTAAAVATPAPTSAPLRRLAQGGGGMAAPNLLAPIALALLLMGLLLLLPRSGRRVAARATRREASGEDPR